MGLFFGGGNRKKKKSTRELKIRILKYGVTLFFPIFFETLDYTVVAIAQTDIAVSQVERRWSSVLY